jgi:hypothetical protein
MSNTAVIPCAHPVNNLLITCAEVAKLYTSIHSLMRTKFLSQDLYVSYATFIHRLYTRLVARFVSVTENLYTVCTALTTKTIYKYIIKEY